MRADRRLEARLPVPRCAHRRTLRRSQHRDEQAGQRNGDRVTFDLQLRLAEEAFDPGEWSFALRGVQHGDQRAQERGQRRTSRPPQQRDQRHEHDRHVGEPRPHRAVEARTGGASKSSHWAPRNSAQAIAPATNAGIVMPPDRRTRNCDHVTINGATSSVPMKFDSVQTRNVRSTSLPSAATCQTVASSAPISASGNAPPRTTAASSRAMSSRTGTATRRETMNAAVPHGDDLDHAIARRVEHAAADRQRECGGAHEAAGEHGGPLGAAARQQRPQHHAARKPHGPRVGGRIGDPLRNFREHEVGDGHEGNDEDVVHESPSGEK